MLRIDRIVRDETSLVLVGWVIGSRDLAFSAPETEPMEPDVLHFYPRPDVAAGYAIDASQVSGFLAIWTRRRVTALTIGSRAPGALPGTQLDLTMAPAPTLADRQTLAQEHVERLQALIASLLWHRDWAGVIYGAIPAPPADWGIGHGHLEQARGIEGLGGIVVGWAAAEPSMRLLLLGSDGHAVDLAGAERWSRKDIIDGFYAELGEYATNAGFLTSWLGGVRTGDALSLVALTSQRAYRLSEITWKRAPVDPVSFARWAFDFPTSPETFPRRVASHDAPIISKLIERRKLEIAALPVEEHAFGRANDRPACSIVIPLYGRFDFMFNQLLEFSNDPFVRESADIIYVVDDPRILSGVLGHAPMLERVNGVPFRVVWGGINRGFAGATNLGASVARAPQLLLLNSDVIPVQEGWLERMLRTKELNPSAGILGARLLYPNGSVQHVGMEFRWDHNWNAWLNKHPMSGLHPPESEALSTCEAVTAACMLVGRALYAELGGLDDEFLVGDFEDSDLCLKARAKGHGIACVNAICLVHLERQSFSGLGTLNFRDKVARFNAFRHDRRWGAYIRSHVKDGATEIAA